MQTLAIYASDNISTYDMFGEVGRVWLRICRWAANIIFLEAEADDEEEPSPSNGESEPSLPDPPTLGINIVEEINTEDTFG